MLSRQLSRKSCACAVFSKAVEATQSKKLRLCGVFECCRGNSVEKLRLCGVFECCRGSSVEKAAPVRCFRVLSRQLNRKSCACAVFSSAVEAAQSKKLRLCGVFECGRASLRVFQADWSGEFSIYIFINTDMPSDMVAELGRGDDPPEGGMDRPPMPGMCVWGVM